MTTEKGPGNGGNPWEKFLTEINAPKKNEIEINGAYNIRNRYIEVFNKQGKNSPEDFIVGMKRFIKTEMGPEDTIVRGPVEIAGGEELILAITPNQENAFVIIYDMYSESEASYYASVESIGEKPKKEVDVLIKFCDIKPKSINNLIISEALAKKLGVEKDQDIRILNVYQKTSDINLDEL